MPEILKLIDYCTSAQIHHLAVETIMAVAAVESNGSGYLPDGRIKILFERHKFNKITNGRFFREFPQISNPQPGGYFGGAREYNRFNQAFRLNPATEAAALQATSWGKFQIMGFNYELVGFKSVGAMVDFLRISELNQLDVFLRYCQAVHLMADLQAENWDAFAEGYNGADYRRLHYAQKMAAQSARLKRLHISCTDSPGRAGIVYQAQRDNSEHPALETIDYSSFIPPHESTAAVAATVTPESAALAATITSSRAASLNENNQTPSLDPAGDFTGGTNYVDSVPSASTESKPTAPEGIEPTTVLCKERPSSFVRLWTGITMAIGGLTGIGVNVQALLSTATTNLNVKTIIFLGFGFGLIALALYFYDRSAERANGLNRLKADIASNPDKTNVELKTQKTTP